MGRADGKVRREPGIHKANLCEPDTLRSMDSGSAAARRPGMTKRYARFLVFLLFFCCMYERSTAFMRR